jgi:flavodoxin
MPAALLGGARSVLILYGSETGNAQDIAEELGRLCQRLHFKSHVDPLDAADLVSLRETIIVHHKSLLIRD